MGNFLAEAGFFIGEFSPLGNRKNNPVQLIQRIFVKRMQQQNCQISRKKFLKSPHLDNRFKTCHLKNQDFTFSYFPLRVVAKFG
jgi:hypothetical protein